jgi:hypothetical protein
MDGALSEELLADWLQRPLTPPAGEVVEAIERGPIDPGDALALADAERLLDPAPLAGETGWCELSDGVRYVAVRTELPGVTGEMIDWWFDWHPRDPVRYRIWHPEAHFDNALDPPPASGAKPHWGAVHHPVEDVGLGVVHARIAFKRPTELGLSTDALDDPAVATIVCGVAGDDRLRLFHTPMFHVFLRQGDGVVLRSRFWLGAALRPRVLRRLVPARLPRALARHCAEEYANLGALLPEVHEQLRRDP